jgi:methyl-accepting chemotaxis protein
MKIKVFFITCAGLVSILIASALLVYTQMRAVENINLDTLTGSLYQEDSKILSWVLSSVPIDKIDSMKLPASWAEIFVVDHSDLKILSSTNPNRKGLPLHSHPDLLDQASKIMESMKTGKPSTLSTKAYMVIIQPMNNNQSIIALKPKAWENGLVSKQDTQLDKDASKVNFTLVIFFCIGLGVALVVSFLVAIYVAKPTKKLMVALEALSLGDFSHEFKGTMDNDMKTFAESYLRLKTSLAMALERLGRR